MALDELLLRQARDPASTPVLRLYSWQPATLSLGYFQPFAEAALFADRHHLPVVRRLTGGAAIVHQNELTYSLAVPVSHPLARAPRQIYRLVHEALILALGRCGVRLQRRGYGAADGASSPPGWLCFHRADPDDLVVAGRKIAGSAQRRSAGAVSQHGSVLLAAADATPNVPGLRELTGRRLESAELSPLVAAEVSAAVGAPLVAVEPSDLDQAAVDELAGRKYAVPCWTERR